MAAKTFYIGDNTESSHQLLFAIGSNEPGIRWNSSSGEVELTEDGSSFASVTSGATRLENDSGGQIVEGDLVYISGYNATTSKHQVKKAVVTEGNSTTLYARYVATETIEDGASGVFAQIRRLSSVDTSGGTVGRPVFLSTTAGGWTVTQPSPENRIQIVGFIEVVHASTGRVSIELPGQILPWTLEDF